MPTTATPRPLPPEFASTAAKRLSWMAVCTAVTTTVMFALQHLLQPEVMEHNRLAFMKANAVVLITVSLAVLAIMRLQVLRPGGMLNVGIGYQVFAAFSMPVFEFTLPFAPELPVRRASWAALWISVSALLIPNTPKRSLAGAFGAVCMAPAAYGFDLCFFGHARCLPTACSCCSSPCSSCRCGPPC